jgi:hypothetical protein
MSDEELHWQNCQFVQSSGGHEATLAQIPRHSGKLTRRKNRRDTHHLKLFGIGVEIDVNDRAFFGLRAGILLDC